LEERDRILKMVQDHKITAEEGSRLLDVLDMQDQPAEESGCRVSIEPAVRYVAEWSQAIAQTVARSLTEAVERPIRNNVRPALQFIIDGSWLGA
jgi:hypothetical protein